MGEKELCPLGSDLQRTLTIILDVVLLPGTVANSGLRLLGDKAIHLLLEGERETTWEGGLAAETADCLLGPRLSRGLSLWRSKTEQKNGAGLWGPEECFFRRPPLTSLSTWPGS